MREYIKKKEERQGVQEILSNPKRGEGNTFITVKGDPQVTVEHQGQTATSPEWSKSDGFKVGMFKNINLVRDEEDCQGFRAS